MHGKVTRIMRVVVSLPNTLDDKSITARARTTVYYSTGHVIRYSARERKPQRVINFLLEHEGIFNPTFYNIIYSHTRKRF